MLGQGEFYPPSGKAQLAQCLKEDWQVVHWSGMQASSDSVQGINQKTVDETGVCTTTSKWCTVLGCRVKQGHGSCTQCFSASTHLEPPSQLRSMS